MERPSKEEALAAVETMMRYIGEDPTREGLRGTPERVVRSWETLFGGYGRDAVSLLTKTFTSDGYDQLVLLGPVEFWSTCEHHLLPFYGAVHVGYLPGPDGRVVGVSKLARVVEVYARRLQIQERLTTQIAGAIDTVLGAAGVAVVVRARHLCMVARGVAKQQSWMTTSEMLGVFREKLEARTEFLRLMGDRG